MLLAGFCLENAAGDANGFTGEIFRVRGSEINSGRRNVIGLADAGPGRLRLDPLAKISFVETGRVNAFGLNHAGIDGVHANLAWAQFLGQDAGYGVDGCLGGAIDGSVGR